MTLHLPSIHYLAILPELIVLGASLLLMIATALTHGRLDRRAGTVVTAAAGIASLIVTAVQWRSVAVHGQTTTLAHAVVLDGFAVVAVGTLALTLTLGALVAHDWLRQLNIAGVEYHILALASLSGAMVMAQANDLIVVFLGLEILSIALYVLVAFNRRRTASAESALKYFLLGGFAAALFIYGAALVYGATGTTSLTGVAQYLGTHVLLRNGVLVAGMAMLLVAFAFKVAAVPFHFWSPDVYEGAPTPVTGLMASIVKVGAFVALVRVLVSALGSELTSWRPIVWALILLTTFVGASVALVQSNVKRLLAYSSINQAGFMLLGIWAGTARGVAGTLYYVMTYAPVVVATFAVVALMGGDKDESHDLDSYRGLARRNPWLGGAFAVLLLAQSGAPFTTGFFAKFSVVAAAVDAGGAPLAVLVMIAAAIAAFFYLRLVLSLFVDTELPAVLVPRMTNVVVIAVAGAAIVFGIWVGPLAELAHHAAALFIPVR